MTEKESSWALAPDRNIDLLEREEFNEWDGIYHEVPSFRPQLVSDSAKRETARSSGYGKSIPTVERVVLADDELRPWQEQPKFVPELKKCSKREAARSSGYGKSIPVVKKKEPETPKFKPQLVRTKSGNKMVQSVRSSNYGRATATPKRVMSAPSSPFKPQLPKSSLRSRAKSSGYANGTYTPPSTPRTASAPASGKKDFVPRYSLLTDKGRAPSASEEAEAQRKAELEKQFVLDGVVSSATRPKTASSFGTPDKVKHLTKTQEMMSTTRTSQYGKVAPPSAPKPPVKEPEPSFKFDREHSILTQQMEKFNIRSPLTDKARSSSYGTAPPPQGEKPAPKEPEPQWNLTLKAEVPPEAPKPDRNALTDKVTGHGYGTNPPPVGPKFEIEPQPLWVPTTNKTVNVGPPPPVPKSRLNDSVRSHYGSDYQPGLRDDEDSEEEDFGQQTSVRIRRRSEYEEEEVFVDDDEEEEEEVQENGVEEDEEDDDEEAF